ncbi:endonuclease/exonuclease/phosphatase family protein [Glutamicibacter mishrai]|uniref:endonuclease/exonuclease/phosphatase family protein n=1 Tax=Glutamicibacter mishrai TaxID=1775880 RepID=UPI0020CB8B75|nr:endonuclease/exonuclease/phosphatase family protein [Glutamicibacter mishrai]UTT38757.1 endonuclease/exonuclease/phosphatase family protein [Glutamicibacter mishrai]
MTKDRPQPLIAWSWAILVLLGGAVAALPYISWLAGGCIPRLQAFQPWMLVGVAAAVLFASFKRRWLVATLVMAALIVGALPNMAAPGRQSAITGSSEVSVFSFNALKAGADSKQLAQSIKRTNPDVLVLVETSEALHDRLRAQGALASLEFRSAPVPTGGVRDTVIFSRYPLKELSQGIGSEATGWYGMPVVEIDSPGGTFTVVGVHIFPPLGSAQRWNQGLAALQRWLEEQANRPVILAGDYNSTRSHPQFRSLTSTLDTEPTLFPRLTWPADTYSTPLLGIDHVLTAGFNPVSQQTLRIRGSDHLGIMSTVSFVDQ